MKLMVFRAPRAQQEPHTAEFVREHLDGRLTVQAFKLVPSDHSHPDEKRFQQLNEDVAIGEHAPTGRRYLPNSRSRAPAAGYAGSLPGGENAPTEG
jgi:hypothetical protein